MERTTFDPGLTQQYGGRLRRTINPDGSFNVVRKGFGFRDAGVYLHLINMSWPRFFVLVVAGFFVVNLLFAGAYLAAGIENLEGSNRTSSGGALQSAIFFSVHTLTTVGYGSLAPRGWTVNSIAAIETMIGLMSFAVATSLLFARFSRASANVVFSRKMIVSPFQETTALMLRIANRRPNVLMELEAKVLLMTVEGEPGNLRRRFRDLPLERPHVHFLPLSWTIVHTIDESSPLKGWGPAELAAAQAEVLVLIRGFDDTFGQTVHSRYAYPHNEIVWGARFPPAFNVNEDGELVLELDRLHQFEAADLAATDAR